MTWAQWFLAADLVASVLWLGFRAGRWDDWSSSQVANIIAVLMGLGYAAATLWALMAVGAFRELSP